MSYKYKSLKYKIKYLNICGQVGGYDYNCPETHNFKCDIDTKNYNLCVKNQSICNDENYSKNDVRIPVANILSAQDEDDYLDDKCKSKRAYDYNLANSCMHQNLPIIYEYDNSISLSNFSICTLNVMGICRQGQLDHDLLIERVNILRNYILNGDCDILCFQEMSVKFFNALYTADVKEIYPYCYEENLTDELLTTRNKDIEVFTMTKQPLSKVTVYELEGNLNYTNSMGIYEYENLIIFNCYLQAGSNKSIAQEKKWLHYSRCRSQQLTFIKSLIDTQYKDKNIVMLGDFNFNIDDKNMVWPEQSIFDSLMLQDSWINDDSGYTENTDINSMRYNNKLINKHYRYDAIMCSKNMHINETKLICDQPSLLPKELNEAYEHIIIGNKSLLDKQKIRHNKDDPERYDLFVSDHFGVQTNLTI